MKSSSCKTNLVENIIDINTKTKSYCFNYKFTDENIENKFREYTIYNKIKLYKICSSITFSFYIFLCHLHKLSPNCL